MPQQKETLLIPNNRRINVRRDVTTANLEQKRGDAIPFGKASLLYGETAIEFHAVSDIAALQQHDNVERGYEKKKTIPPAHRW